MRSIFFAIILMSSFFSRSAFADHPIDVQRAAADGQYLRAMVDYERLPKRRIDSDTAAAAARSAWALSLPQKADEEFQRASELLIKDKPRMGGYMFTRAIIDYQEGRHREAILHVRSALTLLPKNALRSRAYLLLGQSLLRTNEFTGAEQALESAQEQADDGDLSEIRFALGEAHMQLAKYDLARSDYQGVGVSSDRLPVAIRQLARIALELKRYAEAKFWLQKGQQEFPESFLDSWPSYALLQVALNEGDVGSTHALLEESSQRYPASDPWFILMQAAAEGYWKENGRPAPYASQGGK